VAGAGPPGDTDRGETTAEIAGRAVTCDLPKGRPGPHFDVEIGWQY
jgi:hypothetical protein